MRTTLWVHPDDCQSFACELGGTTEFDFDTACPCLDTADWCPPCAAAIAATPTPPGHEHEWELIGRWNRGEAPMVCRPCGARTTEEGA